jgi:outer membrane protein OmpA-like peptidoglycan-associated protein
MLALRPSVPVFGALVLALALAACVGGQQSSGTASPAPATSAEASSSPEASGSPTPSAEPSPGATATPNPNLLSYLSGTIVRVYPKDLTDPREAAEDGAKMPDASHGPYTLIFELPGVADFTKFHAWVPGPGDDKRVVSLSVAVSSTGPDSGFADVGTIVGADQAKEMDLPSSASGRWVRVTSDATGNDAFDGLAAYGTLRPRPANAPDPAGVYVNLGDAYRFGAFGVKPDDPDPWYLRVVTLPGGGMSATNCYSAKYGDSEPGTIADRTWTSSVPDSNMAGKVNDEAQLIVLSNGAVWQRSPATPKYCSPFVTGAGPHGILVLDGPSQSDQWPITAAADDAAAPKGYTYTRIGAAMLVPSELVGKDTVILNTLCDSSKFLSKPQTDLLLQWVADGHKLIIYEADVCGGSTAYSFIPYPFVTSNPGAGGSHGDRLILVEDDELGSSDKTDTSHFLDATAYAKEESNQLGDANTTVTHDDHWCGHLFGTNSKNVNGFMQMYALYQKGVIVYEGFDHDDGALPEYRRMRTLELALSVPNGLPCTQKASLAFVIEPNRVGSFVPGKAATLTFPMELLANQGYKGHVTLTATGDFSAAVTPSALDVAGGTQPLSIAVSVPASAKAGTYNVIVNGDDGDGKTAQASIILNAAVPMVKQLKIQRRIRLYGIHFDVDSAHIQPRSESVIAQIAQIMKENPQWRFRVEGHTDSDGGLQHNAVLSQHRAESVVADLVKRYHIAKSRLVPVGYGYSKPVAPNTTSAGKALNRRVELFRL